MLLIKAPPHRKLPKKTLYNFGVGCRKNIFTDCLWIHFFGVTIFELREEYNVLNMV